MTIHILAFHLDHYSKINRQIKQLRTNFAYLYSLSLMENIFLGVLINKFVWTSKSLNISFSSHSRLISTPEECLK